jgi:predicted transcriptional regulator
VARGRTNTEIADELHITLSTVKTHIASLMGKLGARNRVEIASGPTRRTGSAAAESAESTGRASHLGTVQPRPVDR